MFIWGIIISSIILILGIYLVTLKHTQRHRLVMMLALILFFYKLTEYTIFGLTMQLHKIPLEFSTMSYFIFSMTIIFKLKKLSLLAAFMAFISGIGYLISFMILGDDYLLNNGVYLTSMALINHAILYLGSMLILKDLNYNKNEERRIMMFTMIYVIYVSIMNELITFPQPFIFIRILLGGDLLTSYLSHDALSSYTYLLYFLSIFLLYRIMLLIFHGLCKLTHHPSEVNL